MTIKGRLRKLEGNNHEGICTCPSTPITEDMDQNEAAIIYRQMCQCTAHRFSDPEPDKKISPEEAEAVYKAMKASLGQE